MKLVGVNPSTRDAEGGRIGRMEGTNEPNGYVEENDMIGILEKLMPKLKFDFSELALAGQDIYIENGITTAQDGATSSDTLQLLSSFAEQNQLKLDVVAYPTIADNPEDMWKYKAYAKKYGHRLKVGSYKMFLDGSPQGKTAWMSEPYEGEESYRGYPRYTNEEVENLREKQSMMMCNY